MLAHHARRVLRPLVPRRLSGYANQIAFRLVGAALSGNTVYCPCCERSFSRFVMYPTAYCPGCGSYERQRLLTLFLDRHRELLRGSDVLHVAPERGIVDRYRSLARRWFSVDLDPGYPRIDQAMDVTALALPDASFDLVLCSHVIDQVPDQERAVSELHRVTRSGGTAIIQAPQRAYGSRPDLHAAALARSGFEVALTRLEEQDDTDACCRFGLDATDPLFVCTPQGSA